MTESWQIIWTGMTINQRFYRPFLVDDGCNIYLLSWLARGIICAHGTRQDTNKALVSLLCFLHSHGKRRAGSQAGRHSTGRKSWEFLWLNAIPNLARVQIKNSSSASPLNLCLDKELLRLQEGGRLTLCCEWELNHCSKSKVPVFTSYSDRRFKTYVLRWSEYNHDKKKNKLLGKLKKTLR